MEDGAFSNINIAIEEKTTSRKNIIQQLYMSTLLCFETMVV
jgi:hypothetical protein